jgi:class 3 adenylate cyclase
MGAGVMRVPQTQYVSVGGSDVAYQVIGDGPVDLVYMHGSGHVDVVWDYPLAANFLARLASFSRLILFDRRGTGASDRLPSDALPTWEEWTDDLLAVLDAVGSQRAAILAEIDAGPIALLFAALHPERTTSLVLANTAARLLRADDYPGGLSQQDVDAFVEMLHATWGTEDLMRLVMPSVASDRQLLRDWARYARAALTPRAARAWYRYGFESMDVRSALPLVRTPALVLHRTGFPFIPLPLGRYLADHLDVARFVELDGADTYLFTEASEQVIEQIAEFITGERRSLHVDRSLATVVFTDIVESTQRAARVGDQRWRQLITTHDEITSQRIHEYGGQLVKSTGDGALARFDGPARAIRCALALRDALAEIDLPIRVGLHAGEVERNGDDLAGIAVHIGARVMAAAAPGEVLVSRTVVDLVAGSQITFEERGEHKLKGVPRTWELFAVQRPRAS